MSDGLRGVVVCFSLVILLYVYMSESDWSTPAPMDASPLLGSQ